MAHGRVAVALAAALVATGLSAQAHASTAPAVHLTSSPATVRGGTAVVVTAAVPPRSSCRLSVFRAGRVGFASQTVFVAKGAFVGGWTMAGNPAGGAWTLSVACGRTPTTVGRLRGWTSRRALVVRGTGTRLATTAPVIAAAPPRGGLGDGPPGRFGQVLLAAADWSGGVDVRSDSLEGCPALGTDHGYQYCDVASYTTPPDGTRRVPTGVKYQSVELALRVMVARGWLTSALPVITRAADLYSAAPTSAFDRHPQGNGYTPVPGDLIVWGSGLPGSSGLGHVAVVDRVDGATVRYAQQNAASPVGTLVLGRRADVRYVTGYLHARANIGSIPGTGTPPPNAAGFESLTSFLDPAGDLHLFVLTTAGIRHYEKVPGGGWTDELAAVGQFSQMTAVDDASTGGLELFAVTDDGINHYSEPARGTWGAAEVIVNGQFREISASVDPDSGALHLFALSDRGIDHYSRAPGAPWAGEAVAAGLFTQISSFEDPADHVLHVFAITGQGINHYADLPGTPWGAEVLETGDFTQIVAFASYHELNLFALDADGINEYGQYPGSGWGGVGQGGRFTEISAFVDPADNVQQLFALSGTGVVHVPDPPATTASPDVAATGRFSQISALVDPASGELHLFAVTATGVDHYSERPGAAWTSETAAS